MLQTYLHLLLKISESLARLESLLLIASPDDPSSPEFKNLPMNSLAASSEDSDSRCGPPHHAHTLAYIQLTKGLEEIAQSILFVSQQNTPNSSITFQKLRLIPGPHLLMKFNGSVNCLCHILHRRLICIRGSAEYSQHCRQTLTTSFPTH